MGEENFVEKMNDNFYRVQSLTDPKKFYIVRHERNEWRCSCPAFVFHEGMCKHIKLLLDKLSIV